MGSAGLQPTLISAAETPQLNEAAWCCRRQRPRSRAPTTPSCRAGARHPDSGSAPAATITKRCSCSWQARFAACVGDTQYRMQAGDVLLVPAHAVHSFEATGGETLGAIGVTPAGTRTFRPPGEKPPLND